MVKVCPAHIEPAESLTAALFNKIKAGVVLADLPYMIYADISRYQYPMDFDKLWSMGVRVVVIRASVGDYYTDPRVDDFYEAAKAKGFLVSFYHATAPRNPDTWRLISAQANIDRFLSSIDGLPADFRYTLDNELVRGLDKAEYTNFLAGCFQLCPPVNGFAPANYTRQSIFDPATNPSEILKAAELHAARYKVGLTSPWSDGKFIFRDYRTWGGWQYSADGNGKGHAYGASSDDIDLDYYPGSLDDFKLRMGIVVPPPVEPPPDAVSVMWNKGLSEGWWK